MERSVAQNKGRSTRVCSFLFSLDVRTALKGRLPLKMFFLKAKEFYADWLKEQPEPIPDELQLKFTTHWAYGWMKEYEVSYF